MKITEPETGEELSVYPTQAWLDEVRNFDQQECTHNRKELRVAVVSGGGKACRYQCLDCGELIGNAVSLRQAPASLPQVDVEYRDQQRETRAKARLAIHLKHALIQRDERAKGEDWYAQYRMTAKWADKRAKVMQRAGNLCEGCRERPAQIIHHLTYEHIGDELLFELVALCRACHSRCHPERDTQPGLEHEQGDSDRWRESRCDACRWGGQLENHIEWCGRLDVPATQAQTGDDQCSKVREPLK